MTGQPDLAQQISECLATALQIQDPDVKIQVKRTSLGWFHLNIVSSAFNSKNQIEREKHIDSILEKIHLNLGGYPFAGYSLSKPQEDTNQEIPLPYQLPLWSEILMAPELDTPVPFDEGATAGAFVVTFYSFKGGVGRSTALGFVANILAARGRRVVMIDFDLEAPGLSFMFPLAPSGDDKFGALDYIHQRYLTPEQNIPIISKCIRQVDIPTRGELYLVPAGEYDESYIHRLADLDIQLLYQREANPIRQLLDDIRNYLEPDIILLDARTGFTEMGAIALLDQADLGIICFSPTDQSFAGLQWVVKAASKRRSYRGIPDLRFLLTPMPVVAPSQHQIWVGHAADWITSHWRMPSSLTVEELYYQIPYNSNIATLDDLVSELPAGILEAYIPVADAITASLPEPQFNVIKLTDSRQTILKEVKFRSDTAQEMNLEDIPKIFQRTGDFSKFMQDRTWLVRGAKGTGKTLLFRLFVERSADGRALARPYTDLGSVDFIPGHGSAALHNTLLTSTDLRSYEEQAGSSYWTLFWLNYMLLQIVSGIPELQALSELDSQLITLGKQEKPQHGDIVKWLVNRAASPQSAPQAGDEMIVIDRWLQSHQRKVWLLYDELDAGFGQDYDRRRRALEALLGWWVENGSGFARITPKILLREDIWAKLNFTNKAYFSTRFVQLRWEEDDLWRLILRQALSTSETLAALIQHQFSVAPEQLDNVDKGQLQKSLYPLWGERMGRGNKAYTYNWVRNRISDSKNNRFPRSLIQLLQRAVEIEKDVSERASYEVILRPRSLIDALPFVSEQRVAEVRNEYPEYADFLDKLSGARSPISFDQLRKIWNQDSDMLNTIIEGLKEAGVLQDYLRSQDNDIQRYSVAELYLYGLKMTRQGQR
jgi:MinD-like ATPase involved in chromosome partitioning or flagellar assembly/stress-induced morphogen